MQLSTPGTVNLTAKYHLNVCPQDKKDFDRNGKNNMETFTLEAKGASQIT